MKNLFLFEEYQEIYNYVDFILYDNNEKLSLQSIVDKIDLVINKIKNFSYDNKKRILTYFFTSLLSIISINNVIQSSNHIKDPVAIEIINQLQTKYKNPTQLSISENGKQNIKKFEKLRLKAYEVISKHKKKKIRCLNNAP